MDFSTSRILASLIAIFLAIGIHEYAHCKMADMAGDPTPGIHGRVTLNLFKHFEIMGTIMILVTVLAGVGLGWGKPAPMDPRRMENPKRDFFWAVAAGPISTALREIVINVDADGEIIVSGRKMSGEDLRALVEEAVKTNPEQKVTVRGDKRVAWDSIATVLDICRQGGIQEPFLDTVPFGGDSGGGSAWNPRSSIRVSLPGLACGRGPRHVMDRPRW